MSIDPTFTFDDDFSSPPDDFSDVGNFGGDSGGDSGGDFDDNSGDFGGNSDDQANPKFVSEQVSKIQGEISLEQLKDLLASQLCQPERLKRPEGIATGYKPVDDFLLWSGLPKGHLSMFCGALGTGATSLWVETANRIITDGLWAGWINGDVPLAPQSLFHKKMDLGRFVSIEKPTTDAKLFWVLQEMMSSSLFEFIGCDLGSMRLREHQLRKLQTQARESNIALVFLSQLKPPRGSAASILSLIVHFQKKQILIERALHRPTPHSIPRSITYARFTLHADHSRLPLERSDERPKEELASNGEIFKPSALSQASRATVRGL